MVNAVRVTQKREWLEGSAVKRPGQLSQISIETTSDLIDEKTQIVGTTHEAIALGDVTDDAYLEVSNPHATAVIQIGIDDTGVFVPLIDIPPGYPAAVIPLASSLAGTYLKSDTASTPIRITLIKIVEPA
jgi:hypothetical protein